MCLSDVALCKSSPKSSIAEAVIFICCFGVGVFPKRDDPCMPPPKGAVFGKGGADAFVPPPLRKGENEGAAVAAGAIPVASRPPPPPPICVRGVGIFNPDAVVFTSLKLPPPINPPPKVDWFCVCASFFSPPSFVAAAFPPPNGDDKDGANGDGIAVAGANGDAFTFKFC